MFCFVSNLCSKETHKHAFYMYCLSVSVYCNEPKCNQWFCLHSNIAWWMDGNTCLSAIWLGKTRFSHAELPQELYRSSDLFSPQYTTCISIMTILSYFERNQFQEKPGLPSFLEWRVPHHSHEVFFCHSKPLRWFTCPKIFQGSSQGISNFL